MSHHSTCAPPPHHRWLSSYTAVYRWRSGLPCCRCSHMEQSETARHVSTLYAFFPRKLEGFSLQAFLSMTRYLNFCSACAVTVVIFGHLNRSFYLLTYLLTPKNFTKIQSNHNILRHFAHRQTHSPLRKHNFLGKGKYTDDLRSRDYDHYTMIVLKQSFKFWHKSADFHDSVEKMIHSVYAEDDKCLTCVICKRAYV